MPEAATVGVLPKKVFFKISQNSQETPVPEETILNFAKFLRTPFYRTIPDDCFETRTLLKRSERNRLFLLQRGGCNAYCFG